MANVCFIPLSYLFTRGQGIKLFSLCLKEYRKHKYVFPVIKPNKLYQCKKCGHEFYNLVYCPNNTCKSKAKIEIEMESCKYEGAMVLNPIPGIEYEAISVKDYASLYPSSIIHKNMSHETIVLDSKYKNLTNVSYYDAFYKDNDGSLQHKIFAKVDNELGVLPTILNNLLSERKIIKQKLKLESDTFKIRILEAKQFALKITANSLYGQLGAATSQIRMRDIAASTTSTGREMLFYAKKFDEEILPCIINTHQYFKNDIEHLHKLYIHYEFKEPSKIISIVDKYLNENSNLTIQPIVRYGDSVVANTPILVYDLVKNKICIKLIKDLVVNCEFEPYHDDKMAAPVTNFLVWTDRGWTKINKVIKHKLLRDKKLYRVTTHSGSVVVTDDHSMLTCINTVIKPTEIKSNTTLQHSYIKLIGSDDVDVMNINITSILETSDPLLASNVFLYLKLLNHNVDVDYNNDKYILKIITTPHSYKLRHIVECTPTYNEEVFDLEISKCQLLCKKCHEEKTLLDMGRVSAKITHGTLSSYRYCKCGSCKKAKSEYMRSFRKKKKEVDNQFKIE